MDFPVSFKKWLSLKNFVINDHPNQPSVVQENGEQSKDFSVEFPWLKDNKIKIVPSLSFHLKNITKIGSYKTLAIDPKCQSEIDFWQKNYDLRLKVLKEVIQKLPLIMDDMKKSWKEFNAENPNEMIIIKGMNIKFQRRLDLLKSYADQMQPREMFEPNFKYYYVIDSLERNSPMSCLLDLVPIMIDGGIPIAIVSDQYCTTSIAFLRELLVHCGTPSSVFTHLIDLNVPSSQGQIVSYILTETADFHSAVDNLLDLYELSNLSSVKIYAQESLVENVRNLIEHRLNNLYPEDVLFREFFDLKDQPSRKALIGEDLPNNNQPGIWFNFYRTNFEVISLLNRRLMMASEHHCRFVSIWCEESGMAIKMARDIKNTNEIFLNHSKLLMTKLNGKSPLELFIGHQSYSKFVQENKSKFDLNVLKPNNEIWPLMNDNHERAQLLIRMLTKTKFKNLMATNGKSAERNVLYEFLILESNRALSNYGCGIQFCHQNSELLCLDYRQWPLGNLIIHLCPKDTISESDLTVFLSLCFQNLLCGNRLIFIGDGVFLEHFEPIIKCLNDNPQTSNIIQMIKCSADDQVLDYSTLLLINDDNHRIESLFINQNRFIYDKDDDYNFQHFNWLQRSRLCPLDSRRSISIALQEYDMKNMVE